MADYPATGEKPWGQKLKAYIDAAIATAVAGVGGGGGTGSAVTSVNTKTGAVVLNAADVGAAPTSHSHTAAQVGAIPAAEVTVIDVVTQAEYDALSAPGATTFYVIAE